MPTSIWQGKPQIKKYIQSKGYKRILDIGVGRGTYGLLFKDETGYDITGIDAIDYRYKFPYLEEVYTNYYKMDMRETDKIKELGQFDVIILGDVLEHISVEEAQRVIECYKTQCKSLIVAVPYEYPQIVKSNPYENHIQDDLTHEIFNQRYPGFARYKVYNQHKKEHYGYYIWECGHDRES